MSEDNNQSDSNEEHLADKQQIANWMKEVVKGQEAWMKMLNYLVERDGSRVDEVTKSEGDEETPSTDLHLGVELERIPDRQQLPDQTSNAREKPGVEVRKSSEQKLQSEQTFYKSPHLPHVDSIIITKNRKEKRALLHEKPSSNVPNQLPSLQSDGKDDEFMGLNYTDNSKASRAVLNEVTGLRSGSVYSRSSDEYNTIGYML